jgi:hypothetical protein
MITTVARRENELNGPKLTGWLVFARAGRCVQRIGGRLFG